MFVGETATAYGNALKKRDYDCMVAPLSKVLPVYKSGDVLSIVVESRPTDSALNKAFIVDKAKDYKTSTFVAPPLWATVDAVQV